MNFRITTLIAGILVLLIASPASSKPTRANAQYRDAKIGKSEKELREQIRYSSGHIRFWNNKGRWALYFRTGCDGARKISSKKARICLTARRDLKAHTWLRDRARSMLDVLHAPQPHVVVTQTEYLNFLCISKHEDNDDPGQGPTGWQTSTGNGYYGGLQMDLSFQQSYGSRFMRKWGTANNWPAWAQIEAAVVAMRSGRGYYPWPNTARACGLI